MPVICVSSATARWSSIRSVASRSLRIRVEREEHGDLGAVPSVHVPVPIPPSRAYRMAMPARVQEQEWTADRALALPNDGNRYEVTDIASA